MISASDAVISTDLAEHLCRTLEACAAGAGDLERTTSLGHGLRDLAAAGREAALPEIAECAELLADLAEIAGCVADTPTHAHEPLATTLSQGAAALQRALQMPMGNDAPLRAFVLAARQRWGEYLSLISPQADRAGDAGQLEWADTDRQGWPAQPHTEPAEQTGAAAAAAEVGLILGALSRSAAVRPQRAAALTEVEPGPPAGKSVARGPRSTADLSQPEPAVPHGGVAASSKPAAPPATPERIPLDAELCEAYLDDVGRCVASLEEAILNCESGGARRSALNQVCRDLHTLKGASASVGLSKLAAYLHSVEDYVQGLPADDAAADLDAVLHAVDAVRAQMRVLESPDSAGGALPDRQHVASLREYSSPGHGQRPSHRREPDGRPAAPTSTAAVPAESALAAGVPGRTAGAAERAGELGCRGTTTDSLPAIPPTVRGALESGHAAGEDTVRVRASQLDRLMNMLAELVVQRNQRDRRFKQLQQLHEELQRSVARLRLWAEDGGGTGRHDPRGADIAAELGRTERALRDWLHPMSEELSAESGFVRRFRQELTELRRVPLSGLFQRLQRAARDAARSEDKQVRVVTVGERSGLERSLQEQLFEPLLHIVRNAVSHGIEPPADRAELGKPPQGTVTLEARFSTETLLLEVRDDGRGLDFAAIRQRGLEQGLLSRDRPAAPSELARLIFHPGFSTRHSVSAVSGRGVGMDVVADTLERLRGTVEVSSEPGRGTTVRLTVPLPSLIEHVMLVRVRGQLLAVPMYAVQSSPGWVDDAAAGLSAGGFRGPAIDVGELLGLGASRVSGSRGAVFVGTDVAAHSPPGAGESEAARGLSGSPAACAAATVQTALLVDDVVGPEEIVVQALPRLVRRHPCFSGVALSSAGETVLMLDVRRFIELAVRRASQNAPRSGPASLRPSTILQPDELPMASAQVPDASLPLPADLRRAQPAHGMPSACESSVSGSTAPRTQPCRPAGATQPDGWTDRPSIRVLVVDDALSARRWAAERLEQLGLDVAEAADGLEALEQLRQGDFGAVFSDLHMPRMGGLDLLRELRRDGRTHALPVVIVSSCADERLWQRALELGALACLPKPLSEQALSDVLPRLFHSTHVVP